MRQGLFTRLAVLFLAVAFLSGTMPQLISAAPAQPQKVTCLSDHGMAQARVQSTDCGGMHKHSPIACPQSASCVAVSVMAIPAGAAGAARLDWTAADFPEVFSRLTGRTVPPGLSPPILLG